MPTETTVLLQAAVRGDAASARQLSELLYRELHEIAERQFRHERRDHTLQPTAIVHEALVRLFRSGFEAGGDHPGPAGKAMDFEGRTHFLAVASQVMRRVLIDHARTRDAAKRGGGARRVTLASADVFSKPAGFDIEAIEDALQKLGSLNERQARVIEMRFFAGMTEPEVAAALGVSERTIRGDWIHARAWLRRELGDAGAEG